MSLGFQINTSGCLLQPFFDLYVSLRVCKLASKMQIADVSASGRYLEKTTQSLSDLGASLSVKQNPGDLFISIAGTVGKLIITKIKCCIHDGFIWFNNPKFNKDFLYYIFLSEAPYRGLGKLGTQLNLNTDTIGQIFIPVPSKKEQRHTADYLDKKCSELTELQENIKQQISTLEQYRKSLIHECVTGKRRVNEDHAKANLNLHGHISWILKMKQILLNKESSPSRIGRYTLALIRIGQKRSWKRRKGLIVWGSEAKMRCIWHALSPWNATIF